MTVSVVWGRSVYGLAGEVPRYVHDECQTAHTSASQAHACCPQGSEKPVDQIALDLGSPG